MDFMKSLVEVATKKVQPMVISRMIARRLTHKDVNKCMQLHLHTSFQKIKLLTRGFFEVTFNEKHKDFEPRKLAMVEYKDYTFQISKWKSQFNPSAPRAKLTLSYTFKAQFFDMTDIFFNKWDFTTMASSIGKVLEIEAMDTYVKRVRPHWSIKKVQPHGHHWSTRYRKIF